MAERIAAYPWATHPLGPIERWPQSLKTAVSLILNSQHPMWIGWGDEMWFLYNDAYLHVLGAAKHEWALGRPAEEVWAEIWDVCGPLADKVFDRGEASFVDDVQLFMDRGDMLEETFYSFSYSPIREEAGEVGGLFCPSNDVTAKVVGARRSRTLAELAANGLVERSTDAALEAAALTLEKNPTDVPFALLFLGNTLQRSLGVDASTPLDPRITSAVAGVLESGRSARVSIEPDEGAPRGALALPVVDGVVLPLAGRAEALPLGALVIGINPTCRYDDEYSAFFDLIASTIGTAIQNARAAEDEKRRADMLAEMDRAKTVFFASVSHEFRTPLTLMLGPLEQMERAADEDQRMLASTARRNALRLLKLVNTLLEFSRLESGRNDATFSATDLAALTVDVASSFRSAIESAGLHFDVRADFEGIAYVDRSMWERILLNLLSNALKFTFDGSIAVRLTRDGDAAELRVSDSGVGIAEDELDRLFERFHRVRGAKSRSHEGSGIGLALVRDLVGLHGGTITVESLLGEGTTFIVRVPLGTAHLDPARVVNDDDVRYVSAIEQYLADLVATTARPSAALPSSVGAAKRPRVLVADDNADLRDYVGSILGARYDVLTATNGREALDVARRTPVDLIVSDVMMPEMDGFEFVRAVRADAQLATLPFIMLSARAGEEAASEGLMEGADDYITKPFSADELLARVYAQLNAAKLREASTAQLRASEERFRTLASSLPCIAFEANAAGALTFVSDEFVTYTGAASDAALGDGWLAFVACEDASVVRAAWNASVAQALPFAYEVRLRRNDGAYRWFAANALPQHGSLGEVLRYVGTFTDVHDRRQAARERDFLLRASEIFARATDLSTTLDAIAHLMVPDIADWAHVHLASEDGRVRTVAFVHRDAHIAQRVARTLIGRTQLDPDAEQGSPEVLRSGTSQILNDISPELLDSIVGADPELRAVYEELEPQSSLLAPIRAESTTLGVLSLSYGPSGRRYTPDDLPMLEELGRRAGLAIETAKLYEREHRAAESFQEASLPAQLVSVPGLFLDAYYSPGRDEAQVGGDWYDAVRLSDGRVVISIGDVAGSGLDAAVTMGNMRQVIRGIAQVHADPALMLDAADRALRLEHPDTFVTAFVAVYDAIAKTLTYASAGHPPPLIRDANGRVETLATTGLPLGLRWSDKRGASTAVAFDDGCTLVLYTDGLTEFEREPERAEQRLHDALARGTTLAEDHPARAIVATVVGASGTRDDVAVLVARTHRPDDAGRWLTRWQFDTHDSKAATAARRAFAEAIREHGATPRDVSMAETVFGELVGNTVRYAPGDVEVVVDWSTQPPALHVLDNGPGFRPISFLQPPEALAESGRGLFIVDALTEEFRVTRRPSGGSHACALLHYEHRDLRTRSSG